MFNKNAFDAVELWKPVTYQGIYFVGYEVSNKGNVKTLKNKKNRLLTKFKIGPKNKRYLCVSMSHKNKSKVAKVHVLMSNAFIRERKRGEVIDHKDGNKDNNNLSNLQIITNRQNSSKEKTIKSGYPVGVRKHRYNYDANIFHKEPIYLGCYEDISTASDVYQLVLGEILSDEDITTDEIHKVVDEFRKSNYLKPIKRRK